MKKETRKILAKAQHDCVTAGVRLTEKRQNVLSLLLENAVSLSAYEIVDLYRDTFGESLPAMSVYRMLGFLVDNHLVHKLETTNQFIACAHIRCDHEHEAPQFLICDQCHEVKEVGIKKSLMAEINSSIESTGFFLPNQQLELHGLCAHCKSSAKA